MYHDLQFPKPLQLGQKINISLILWAVGSTLGRQQLRAGQAGNRRSEFIVPPARQPVSSAHQPR